MIRAYQGRGGEQLIELSPARRRYLPADGGLVSVAAAV